MQKIIKKFRQKKESYGGFSFIEGILAAFIVTVGMIAVVQLMTANLLSSYNSRNAIMATFLAQEGVELVRNMRDNNWTGGLDTFDNSNFPGSTHANCLVDISSTDIKTCNNGASAEKTLRINPSTGAYVHNNSYPNSRFQRKIMVTYDTGNRNTASSAIVTSVVVWNGSFPTGAIDANSCNQINQCVFVSIVLNKWGE